MKELSLHILDIVQNSTNADASEILIRIIEDVHANLLEISIEDDGCGIQQEKLATITNPFSTSRTTRRVGLGLSLLKLAAEQCNGTMTVESEEGKGTRVLATFEHNHIDRVPLGNMPSTIITFIIGHPEIDFRYEHQVNKNIFEFNTKDVKQELGEEIPISDVSVVGFLTEFLESNVANLYEETEV